jgi:hypothetical protein
MKCQPGFILPLRGRDCSSYAVHFIRGVAWVIVHGHVIALCRLGGNDVSNDGGFADLSRAGEQIDEVDRITETSFE